MPMHLFALGCEDEGKRLTCRPFNRRAMQRRTGPHVKSLCVFIESSSLTFVNISYRRVADRGFAVSTSVLCPVHHHQRQAMRATILPWTCFTRNVISLTERVACISSSLKRNQPMLSPPDDIGSPYVLLPPAQVAIIRMTSASMWL